MCPKEEYSMALIRRIFRFLPVAMMALAGLAAVVNAQPVTCTPSADTPLPARTAGNTELVRDIVLSCTGGTPTPAGSKVPQINLSVVLNTNATSLVTEHNPAHLDFSEALLLVDEPNRGIVNGVPAATPLLNCGNTGAPDNGPLGPGVCEITKTVNPAQTYDGTPCVVAGAAVVKLPYGCGRPNAFQGRPATRPPAAPDRIDFVGVPFDPPGTGTGVTRILRITNVRADAAALGGGAGPHAITASLSVSGAIAMSISPSTLTVATSFDGLIVSALPGMVHLVEGFASAWKYKNVAFALADATSGTVPYPYIVGDTNYPADAAQNVPGVFYNTEEGLQWNPVSAIPSPNPPLGYASGITAAPNYPLFSAGYGGLNTGISDDGVSSAGTRIALFFAAFGESVTVPNVVYLYDGSGTASGVMVLTSTDPNGAGTFSTPPPPATTTTIHNFGMVVYEVLYSNPFANEYADVPLTVSGPPYEVGVVALLAPFYLGPDPTFPTPTTAHPEPTAIPRFAIGNPKVLLVKAPPVTAPPAPTPPAPQ